ncbi:MAG: hypothetical protein HKN91_01520 [Acidimicrobiia bacterium]|nr:hypothetical protein [Acidimicrobiia bacterium]
MISTNGRVASCFLAVALVLASCGGSAGDVVDSTTTTAAVATTSPTTTSSVVPTTASPPPSTTLVGLEPVQIPRLDDGLPATFVAVTDDWEAVEVNTATGERIRSIAQFDQPSETGEEPGFFNAIQNIWRSPDGAWYAISTCCEPAAGAIYFIPQDGTLDAQSTENAVLVDGWTAAPSPFDDRFATLGFSIAIGAAGEDADIVHSPDPADGMPNGSVAWHNNGHQVSWLSSDRGRPNLVTLDLDNPESGPDVVPLDWVDDTQWLQGIAMQQSGRFVAFLNSQSDDPEAPELIRTEGVAFDEFGLIATFDVELGSFWGGYEPSGRMLIYTDGDNVVRWQGLGKSGVLGEGYLHASW